MPYSKVRIKAMRALGHRVGDDVYFPSDLVITQNFVSDRGTLVLGNRVFYRAEVCFYSRISPECLENSSRHKVQIKRDSY